MVVEVLAAATVVEGIAMAAGEWVRCTAVVGGTEGWAAVRRRAGLAVEGVGPLEVEGLAADGPAGVQEIEGTRLAPLPMGSGTRSEQVATGWRHSTRVRDLVASAGLRIGADGAVVVVSVGVEVIGVIVGGEGAGAAAGDLVLASALAGGPAGILFGIGRRIRIAHGGATIILPTFIRIHIRGTARGCG